MLERVDLKSCGGKTVKVIHKELYSKYLCIIYTDNTCSVFEAGIDYDDYPKLDQIDDSTSIIDNLGQVGVKFGLFSEEEYAARRKELTVMVDSNRERWEREEFERLKLKYEGNPGVNI